MDKGIRVTAALFLATIVVGAAQAADITVCEAPNPFAPVPIRKETLGTWARHGLDTSRHTVTEYFKVYPEELDNTEKTTLEKLTKDPAYYVDRIVEFDVYFGKLSSFYRTFVTQFTPDVYINFSGWPYGAPLWTKEGRLQVHLMFYIDKKRLEEAAAFANIPAYTPMHIWGSVKSRADGMPWIEVLKAKVIPEVALRTETLRHLETGHIQLAKKRYDLAAQALEDALALDMPVVAQAPAYSMLGRAYYEQRSLSAARNALASAVIRDPRNVENLLLLARTDLRIDKAEEAQQAAERAIELEPSNPLAHAELGLAVAMRGDIRSGYRELDFAQKLAPKNQLPEANRNRAMIALREGKLTIARDELNQAELFRPTDVELKLEMGDVYVALNDYDKARLEYNQARELAPQRPESYYKLALLLKKQGDAAKKDGKEADAKKFYEDALDNTKNAIQRNDQYTPAYGLQAEILRALGRNEDATKVLEKGVLLKPKDTQMQKFAQQHLEVLEGQLAEKERVAAEQAEKERVEKEQAEAEKAKQAKKEAPVIEELDHTPPTPANVPGPR
ncbi:MAG TPA: DUF2225 domain-containing protein [Planctomycetota bacterium]|jgi:tetratricopeptide (TPR) repeat protein